MENQAVWLWAVDPGEDDPPVYDRENSPFSEWRPTGVRLSTFLLHVAVFEAVMDSRYGACAATVTEQQLTRLLAPMRPLPMADWRWPVPGHRLHAGPDLLAFAGPNPPDRGIWVAARRPEAMAYLVDVDVEWETFSPMTGPPATDRKS